MKLHPIFLVLAFSLAVGMPAPAQTPSAPPASAQHSMADHATAMHHHMQMQVQVTKMRATLDQMKTNLTRIPDPALKQQAQLDVELWESMVQHMEDMVKMMSMDGAKEMMEGHDHSSTGKKDTPMAKTR